MATAHQHHHHHAEPPWKWAKMHNLKTVATDCLCNNYFIYLFCVPTFFICEHNAPSYIAAGISSCARCSCSTHMLWLCQSTMCPWVYHTNERLIKIQNPTALNIIRLMSKWKRKTKKHTHFHVAVPASKPKLRPNTKIMRWTHRVCPHRCEMFKIWRWTNEAHHKRA